MSDFIVKTNILYLVAIFFIIFLLREIVAYKRILKLKYVFTPLVTYMILIVALYLSYVHGFSQYNILIIAGLMFSLIADTLLMIEEISLFIHGLLFFLFAHVCYAYALSIQYVLDYRDAILVAIVAGISFIYYLAIHRARGKFYLPVIIYMSVLSLVVVLALGLFLKTRSTKGIVLAIAAILFAISDGVLAFNQFIRKIPHSTVVTWSLYAPAQLLFAFSCYY